MPEPRPPLTAAQKAERRARRQERRDKQRLLNFTRAKQMHAARLAAPAPASYPPPRFSAYIGCSGWFYWHWRDTFYPSTLPSNQWFSHYAKNFRTVELNAPFYAWPATATVQTWLRQAAPHRNFIYTIKVSELITHIKRFTGTKTLIKDFTHIADLLGPRMGCFLFQCPPSFHYTPARLKNILSQLNPLHRNVLEFRHRSWWNQDVYRAFRNSSTTFCSASGPRLPDDLIQTAPDLYLRFHGTTQWYRHNYSKAELSTWVSRIHAAKPDRLWSYFNNDRDAHAIQNARTFQRLLKS